MIQNLSLKCMCVKNFNFKNSRWRLSVRRLEHRRIAISHDDAERYSVSAVRHLAFLLAVTLSTARLKLSKFIFLFYGRSTQLCLSGSSNVLLNMQLSLADLGFFKAEVTLGTRASGLTGE